MPARVVDSSSSPPRGQTGPAPAPVCRAIVVSGERRPRWAAAVKRCWTVGPSIPITLVPSSDQARSSVVQELATVRGIDVLVQPRARGTAIGLLVGLFHAQPRAADAPRVVTCAHFRIDDADLHRVATTLRGAVARVTEDPDRVLLIGGFGGSLDDGWMLVGSHGRLLADLERAAPRAAAALRSAAGAAGDAREMEMDRVYAALEDVDLRRHVLARMSGLSEVLLGV
jgi:hypothetical protein